MVNFNALYISVGIIASLVVGAPVWWWQSRSGRKKIEEFAPEREELVIIRPQVAELSNVQRQLQRKTEELNRLTEERDNVIRERDRFSNTAAVQRTELLGYDQCKRDLDAARTQLQTARDQQEDIQADIQAERARAQDRDSHAQERLRHFQRELATAHAQFGAIEERHATELAAAIARAENIEVRHATLQQQYDHVNQSYRELLAANHAT